MKPKLASLWTTFPDHAVYRDLVDLYTMLGGAATRNIDSPGFDRQGNTCASRLSVAFNKAGAPITDAIARSVGAHTLGCADGSRIIFRVSEFRRYLRHVLGKPAGDSASPYDDTFRGRKGIIAFTVNWADASGHIVLWNGRNYREQHDNYATFVHPINPNIRTSRGEFWELP